MGADKPELVVLEKEKLMEALRELKRRGFCDYPDCLRSASRVAWDDDGFRFAYCEEHVREMAPLLAEREGKPLLWVKIRGKAQSPEDRLLAAFEDIKFSEFVRKDRKK
jgi:hypothetical protein